MALFICFLNSNGLAIGENTSITPPDVIRTFPYPNILPIIPSSICNPSDLLSCISQNFLLISPVFKITRLLVTANSED